ncbi:response regulator transcription factor [Niabella beijingensis]|uniref:response regulator transcription factor n=1 Tax=Niabella beijingensis TaxID=2872700 RepID=UPI001CBFE495|nr:response regulator transcription factor [Niabella beijingensis]MBZ4188990.1 response regulator transcription factor [Niabella beijingensis]
MKAFLLEDDVVLSSEIVFYLRTHAIACDTAADGKDFLERAFKGMYDVYILDINVPLLNGLDVCRKIREQDAQTPIIIISAYDDIVEKKEAFLRNADDYLVKPFVLEELLLRINTRLRTAIRNGGGTKIVVEDLEIYPDEYKVFRAGKEIQLTLKEFQLLVLLARANGRTLSKQYISDEVWQNQFQTTHNTIEVYINFLRKKIDRQFDVKLIHTRPGFGYYLKPA